MTTSIKENLVMEVDVNLELYFNIKENNNKVTAMNTFIPNNERSDIQVPNDIQKSNTTIKNPKEVKKANTSSDMRLMVTDEADNRTIENNYNFDKENEGARNSIIKMSESLTSSSEFHSEDFSKTTDMNGMKDKILKSDSFEESSRKRGLRPLATFNQREEEKKEVVPSREQGADPNQTDLDGARDTNDTMDLKPKIVQILEIPSENNLPKPEDSEQKQEIEDSESEDNFDFTKLFAARNEVKKIKFRASNCLSPRSYVILKKLSRKKSLTNRLSVNSLPKQYEGIP